MSQFRRLPLLDLLTIAAVLCLCIAAAVLLLQVQAQTSAADWVTHTREVLQRVARANLALSEAEASERGFLLSGEPVHAQRFETARALSAQQLRELVRLTEDNPKQQAVLAHLVSETERRLDTLRANIDRRRNVSLVDAALLHEGTAVLSRLGDYATQLEAEEERLLAERRVAAVSARARVAITGVGIVALALALVLLLRAAALRDRRALNAPRLDSTVGALSSRF